LHVGRDCNVAVLFCPPGVHEDRLMVEGPVDEGAFSDGSSTAIVTPVVSKR